MHDNDKTLVVYDFLDFVQQAKVRASDCSSSRREEKAAFYGTETFDQAIDLAVRGWPAGRDKIGAIRVALDSFVRATVNSRVQSYRYDTTGIDFNMGRALEGEPECWYREEDDEGSNTRVVKVMANLSVSASVSTRCMFMRGAALVAAIDILESLNIRVEAWFGWGVKRMDGKHFEGHVKAKDAHQPLDIDMMAFTLANPSCFRRLVFSHLEQVGFLPSRCRPEETKHMADAIMLRPANTSNGLTDQQVLEDIAHVCSQAGVQIDRNEILAMGANFKIDGVNFS